MSIIVAAVFATQAVAVLAMPLLAATRTGAIVSVVGFGIGFGITSLATPALLADRYGTTAYATIAGRLAAPVTIAKATARRRHPPPHRRRVHAAARRGRRILRSRRHRHAHPGQHHRNHPRRPGRTRMALTWPGRPDPNTRQPHNHLDTHNRHNGDRSSCP
ncbi:hypothetical protein [Micromonospora sicca]|uniref:hypothetical protein n=1 Tax=Micromonospora sicca TaxID=2202420 RepID=UPI001F487922|nr:hypothetical protein [Micromonospora sp. 4G51]